MANSSNLMPIARSGAIYLMFAAWVGAAMMLFGNPHPETPTTVFRFGFLALTLVPAAYYVALMGILGLKRTNEGAAEARLVARAALMALAPAALILPFEFYTGFFVMIGAIAANGIALVLRMRTINPQGNMISVGNSVGLDTFKDDSTPAQQPTASATDLADYPAEYASHTFDDLAGMTELKSALLAAANEAKAVTRQVKGGLRADARNGILLHGEPGNGKTAMVEAMAGTMGIPIIKISFGNLASRWVNQTTEQVVRMFAQARAQAPCVLFLDEVDSVLTSRDGGSSAGGEETTKTTNQILTELVATRGTGVVIVMATNFLERLDQAAIREGRVDFKILVPPPDADAREAIIKAAFAKTKDVTYDPPALAQAVKRWEGFSAARISAVAKEAIKQAQKGDYDIIGFEDFKNALRIMQGSLGVRISEDTPTLEQLHMPDTPRRAMMGVAKRMQSIEEVEAMGGSVPTGLLFAGPPGTGKTLAARSLAKTTQWPLLTASGADLMNDPKNIDALIIKARNARPCIVFIDEADDVFSNRRMSSAYAAAATNKLLTAMDGVSGRAQDILWVAAVNAPDVMDPAAMRGGRFTEKVWFENPDAMTASRIIDQWMGRSKAKFEATLTPAKIASILDGESPANIQAILQQAVNNMIARSIDGNADRLVRRQDLEAARTAVSV